MSGSSPSSQSSRDHHMEHGQTLPAAPALQVTSATPVPPSTDQSAAVPPGHHVQFTSPSPAESNGTSSREAPRETSSTERQSLVGSEGYPTSSRLQVNQHAGFDRVPVVPPPIPSRDGHARRSRRHQAVLSTSGLPSAGNTSGIDHIIPMEEKGDSKRTVRQRIKETIDNAVAERDKYAQKALWTSFALNIAIGVQVFLGAMTAGLAAAMTSARQAQISTAVLGGLSTLVASYLARARGSGEPELSTTRFKDLEQFLRECKAFEMDHGYEYSTPENGLDGQLDDLRRKLEELLGNTNGERRSSPVGMSTSQA